MTIKDVTRQKHNLELAKTLAPVVLEVVAPISEPGYELYVSKIPARTQFEIDRKIEKLDLDEYGYVGGHLRAVSGPTHTVGEMEYIIHVTYTETDEVTITLPDVQATATRRFYVKDAGGNSSENNITIQPEVGSTKTIEGADNFIVNIDNACVGIYSDGENWFMRSAYMPMPTIVEGGELKVKTTNAVGNELLRSLLEAIRVLNLHIASITEEELTPEDIEEE